MPSRPNSGSSSLLSSDSKPRSGPKGIGAWLSSTRSCGALGFFLGGIEMPCSSISISRIMSASSSSLSSSSFFMACIIVLRLRTSPRRFQGAGRGVGSFSSSMAPRTLSLRRKAGVASPCSVDDGVPCSSNLLFFGVTNWFSRKRFPADSGVLSPLALDSSEVSLAASCNLLLGVCGTFNPTSPRMFLGLLGVSYANGSSSNKPSTMPSRCGVGPITVGP